MIFIFFFSAEQLAVCAKHHNIPFYVCAPTTSIDLSLAHGKDIPIEERPHKEMTDVAGTRIAAPGKFIYAFAGFGCALSEILLVKDAISTSIFPL